MRDPEADYEKLSPPPRHVEKQILGAQQKPGLANHLTTAQKTPFGRKCLFSFAKPLC